MQNRGSTSVRVLVLVAVSWFWLVSQDSWPEEYRLRRLRGGSFPSSQRQLDNMDQVRVADDKAGVGQAAAKWLCEQAEAAIADHQSFSVAFSGGSLPSILASGLTDDLAKRCQPDKWQVYFADERLVAHDDDESNYKEVRKTCLAKLNIKPEQVHAIDAGLPVEQAAAAYEADMKASLGPEGRLDVVLLGMGPDGHTCSLFPEHPLLQEQDKLVAPISDSPKPPPQRITLTFKALSHAGQVAFITAGDGKSEVLRSVLMDGDCQLPASMVRSATGLPLWFVDKGAAAKL